MKKNQKDEISSALEDFTNARRRPSVFLLIAESLNLKHVFQLRSALGNQNFEELDLVINSGGGNIHAAYQIIELLRLHAKRIYACVPFYAKSAATLLCLGADKIFLDELAQLGPLDTQIYEEEKSGKGEFTSALNPFKTLEQLRGFSLETLDLAVQRIVTRSGMGLDECLKHAIDFVRGTTGPLFTKLDPEKLGKYSRTLEVGSEYGERLLRRFTSWDDERRAEILEKLVHGYPSHDYIIDYHELKEMGFDVNLFSEPDRVAAQTVLDAWEAWDHHTVVNLVVPKNTSPEQQADPEVSTS